MDNIPAEIVAHFYEASLDPSKWPLGLLAIGEAIRADLAGLAVHDFSAGVGSFENVIGISAEAASTYRRIPAQSNVWFQAESFFRKVPSVVRGTDIIGADALRATSFYRTWLRPTGLLHHLFAVLDRQDSRVTVLMFARRDGAPPFDDATVAELERILPLLARGFRAAAGVRSLRLLERAAIRAIDMLSLGMAVLDRTGAIIEANPVARAAIDAGEGLSVVGGSLVADVAGRRLKLRDLMVRKSDRNDQGDELSTLSIPRASGRRPLTLMLVGLQYVSAADERGPAALLFIGDPERPVRFDQTRIARLYGLSRAESRVAALLAAGYRLEQVAETLDIAYETVRKHLKQIFGKTGTYRQAELVRMLVTGPAGLSV